MKKKKERLLKIDNAEFSNIKNVKQMTNLGKIRQF